jgi:hypothetical protein
LVAAAVIISAAAILGAVIMAVAADAVDASNDRSLFWRDAKCPQVEQRKTLLMRFG